VSESLVSVVIPLFNKEKYISSTLYSVIAQDYRNIELIMIDDGSTDNGYALACNILQNNQQRFTRIITVSTDNLGQTAARNKGVCLARGKFVAFLDADDIWAHKKISTQVAHLEKCDEIDLVICNYVMFYEQSGTSLAVSFTPIEKKLKSWILTTGFGGLIESTGVIRRSALLKSGLFHSRIEGPGGLEMLARFVTARRAFCSKEYLCKYQVTAVGWHNNKVDLVSSFQELYSISPLFLNYKNKIETNLKLHLALSNLKKNCSLRSFSQFIRVCIFSPLSATQYISLIAIRLITARLRFFIMYKKLQNIR